MIYINSACQLPIDSYVLHAATFADFDFIFFSIVFNSTDRKMVLPDATETAAIDSL